MRDPSGVYDVTVVQIGCGELIASSVTVEDDSDPEQVRLSVVAYKPGA